MFLFSGALRAPFAGCLQATRDSALAFWVGKYFWKNRSCEISTNKPKGCKILKCPDRGSSYLNCLRKLGTHSLARSQSFPAPCLSIFHELWICQFGGPLFPDTPCFRRENVGADTKTTWRVFQVNNFPGANIELDSRRKHHTPKTRRTQLLVPTRLTWSSLKIAECTRKSQQASALSHDTF